MKIGVTGASGFIGGHICRTGQGEGHEMIGFSRSPDREIEGCSEVREFSAAATLDVSKLDALIHLAGEPIFGLWTPGKKRRIRESRVRGTSRVVESVKSAEDCPENFVCASGIGFYGDRGDDVLTENEPPAGTFIAAVARDWEIEAEAAESPERNVARLRIGLVLGKEGGALKMMLPVFRAGLGGRLGSGRQFMPWIHVEDVARMFITAAVEGWSGVFNCCAPQPVRNELFTRALAEKLNRPAAMAAPAMALRLLPGGFHHVLLDSARAMPVAAQQKRFQFNYAELSRALDHLLS